MRNYAHEFCQPVIPRQQHFGCAPAASVFGVMEDQVLHGFDLLLVVQSGERYHLFIASARKLVFLIEHVSNAARHPGCEISSRRVTSLPTIVPTARSTFWIGKVASTGSSASSAGLHRFNNFLASSELSSP